MKEDYTAADWNKVDEEQRGISKYMSNKCFSKAYIRESKTYWVDQYLDDWLFNWLEIANLENDKNACKVLLHKYYAMHTYTMMNKRLFTTSWKLNVGYFNCGNNEQHDYNTDVVGLGWFR